VHQVGFPLHEHIEMHGQQNIKLTKKMFSEVRLYTPINARNNRHLHRPNAKISCFQSKSVLSSAGNDIFITLPLCLKVFGMKRQHSN
jgi:hypothetical protein